MANSSQTRFANFSTILSLLFEMGVHRPRLSFRRSSTQHHCVCTVCLALQPFSLNTEIFQPDARAATTKTWHRIEFSFFPSRCNVEQEKKDGRDGIKLAAQIMKKFTSNNKERGWKARRGRRLTGWLWETTTFLLVKKHTAVKLFSISLESLGRFIHSVCAICEGDASLYRSYPSVCVWVHIWNAERREMGENEIFEELLSIAHFNCWLFKT